MIFLMAGVSYQDTSMEKLDSIFLSDTKKMAMYIDLNDMGIKQCVILSTCNRKQVYAYMDESLEDLFVSYIKNYFNTDIIVYKEEQAYRYFFEMVSGLHSLVLGEDQILGQVVEAFEFSKQCGSLKKQLAKIFRDGITCAKRIKNEIHMSEHPLSISYLAIKVLKELTSLENKKVLVVGSGKMANLAITYLIDEVSSITVCNRNKANASKLLEEYPSLIISTFDERYDVMKDCDIVVCATSSPHYVIENSKIELTKDVYLVDLALPKDIDVAFNDHKFAHIIDLPYLQRMADRNLEKRKACIEEAKQIIDSYIHDLYDWLEHSIVDESLMLLQNEYSKAAEDTYDILIRKLDLNDHEKYVLNKTIHLLTKRLLKQPIQVLKNLEASKQGLYNEVVKELFVKGEE